MASNYKKKELSKVEAVFRTEAEQYESTINKKCFTGNPDSWEKKIENFPKYVRRQNLTRFLALYEIFKKIINIKGSIVECGVYSGFGLMSWTKLSAILEPVNLTRRIYGFDSFSGFPSISEKDKGNLKKILKEGDLANNSFHELQELVKVHDSTRFLGHIDKTIIIKGDANQTIPTFIDNNPHILISLLFLDFDLYEPTITALTNFVPRMPKGAIIAFDELDNPLWPGETQAMLEYFESQNLALKRVEFDPYIGYARIE